ncbi:MAG: TorF family putative porin [Hyphomonadaceae bacterium]
MKVLVLTVLALGCVTEVSAQEAPAEQARQDEIVVTGEAALVSDYRWRGVSLTDNDPAIQAGIYASHSSGVYVGVWASAPTRQSSDSESDLSLGYTFSLWDGDFDVAIAAYVYPDLDDTDYTTFSSVYERQLGDWTARARFEYAPTQQNLGDESVYAALEAERPIGETGFALMGSVGWEKGAFTLDGEKWDYLIGGRFRFESVSLDLTYVGTDEDAPPGERSVYGGGLALAVKTEF